MSQEIRLLAANVEHVVDAYERLHAKELELEEVRRELADAIRLARSEGASLALIGRALGISRQAVAKIETRNPPKSG